MDQIQRKIASVARAFSLPESVVSCEIIGNGNINKTYDVHLEGNGKSIRCIFQQVNTFVFKHPEQIMENIDNITAHIAAKLRTSGESLDGVMHFCATGEGKSYCYVGEEFWRAYKFVPNTVSINASEDPEILRAAGRAFGNFQNQLADFDASVLHETIPDFHNTKQRIATFLSHVEEDPCGRVESVKEEIDAILSFRTTAESLCDMLAEGALPLRVTHNDTKINNVLFDADTKSEKAVIDLDTVMPGLVAYDFGDAIRFAANKTAEDDPDLSRVALDVERFRAFSEGFIPSVAASLTPAEIETLPLGAFVMTLELAVRFLDDHIVGDQYFKLLYPGHNLVRTRNQLALAKDIYAHLDEMNAIVREIAASAKKGI